MRLPCPYCGSRDLSEFTYLGDATRARPSSDGEGAEAAFVDYTYLRDNPAGPHKEFWYHAQGCRSWLVVERDTRTHEVLSAALRDGGRAMSQSHRLDRDGLVDRSAPVSFRFDGKNLEGFAGDTLASALIANGVKLVGRSFKYHRPRGILTDGSQEPNALVELRDGAHREPNTKATSVELYDGLVAASQNRWPSLAFDVRAAVGLISPFIPAGFYYKTFMWPASFWEKVYEPAIRRAAGLGRLSGQPDPDTYEKSHAFCDLLIIGGGPAGLMAALAAGRAGARVILCDEDFRLGGRLLSERLDVDEKPGAVWADGAAAELEFPAQCARPAPHDCVRRL